MAWIGIDLGTSFLKGAVLNTDTLRPEHIEREPFPDALSGLPPAFREYDVGPILARVRALLERLSRHAPDCEGIFWSTQMHGLVLADEQGRARSNLLTWLDERVALPHPSGAGSYFDVLVSRITPAERRALGGTELRPGVPVGALFWMAENGRLPPGRLMPVALADWVVANLIGTRPVTDLSNAQAHGALDLEALDWHRGVIEKLGLAGLTWPAIQPQGQVVGSLKLNGRDVPLYSPVGDFQCAAAGALVEPDELWLNISTGSQVSLLLDEPTLGAFQTRPYFDGRYLATVTTIPAGRALGSLVKLFSELALADGHRIADPWAYIAQSAAAVAEPELQANIAFFAGAMGDRGSLKNLREEELTVGHVFRAAFRNMADNYQQCAARLPSASAARRLVFSGGLAQKIELLRQLICDRFQLPHRICPVAEDTPLGLLVLALAFSGRAATVEQAAHQVRESF